MLSPNGERYLYFEQLFIVFYAPADELRNIIILSSSYGIFALEKKTKRVNWRLCNQLSVVLAGAVGRCVEGCGLIVSHTTAGNISPIAICGPGLRSYLYIVEHISWFVNNNITLSVSDITLYTRFLRLLYRLLAV